MIGGLFSLGSVPRYISQDYSLTGTVPPPDFAEAAAAAAAKAARAEHQSPSRARPK
eukprot:SAG31_NODE_44022_length_264_cov_1.224242_1_plen_55_part_10